MGGANPAEAFSKRNPWRTRRCKVKRFATREPEGWAEPIPPRLFQKETNSAPGDVRKTWQFDPPDNGNADLPAFT